MSSRLLDILHSLRLLFLVVYPPYYYENRVLVKFNLHLVCQTVQTGIELGSPAWLSKVIYNSVYE